MFNKLKQWQETNTVCFKKVHTPGNYRSGIMRAKDIIYPQKRATP